MSIASEPRGRHKLSRPLTLPGDRRTQESNRRRILHELLKLERYSLRKAREAADLAKALSGVDVEAIATGDRASRSLLNVAFQIDSDDVGADDPVRNAVCKLIGTDSDYVADQVLRRGRDMAKVLAERKCDEVKVGRSTVPALSPPVVEGALTGSDAVEIDWTTEPRGEYERVLRAEIIAQLEKEGTSELYPWGGAWKVWLSLWGLIGDQSKRVAPDLAAKLAYWERAQNKESSDRTRDKNRELVDHARRALSPPEKLPPNVVRFAPRAQTDAGMK